jgi:hypothetical protein
VRRSGQFNGTTFISAQSPSQQGNITVGNITISPPPTFEQNESFGAVILSATGNIQVNGSIQARATEDSSQRDTTGSAVILFAPQGSITVTGDVSGRSVNLSSQNNITVGNIDVFPGFANDGDLVADSSTIIASRAGDVTVQTIRAPFSQIDVNAFGLFQAKGTFPTSFSSQPKGVPVSIQAQSRIRIQHGGEAFIDGLGVEKDAAGNPIFRVVPGNQRVFLSLESPDVPVLRFVYADGTPVFGDGDFTVDRDVTVRSVPYDSATLLPDTSFSVGLLVLKGGVDAVLRGVFQDSVLAPSSDIGITSVPRPRLPVSSGTPDTGITSVPRPRLPVNSGTPGTNLESESSIINSNFPPSDRPITLQQQPQLGAAGQVAQQVLNKQGQNTSCESPSTLAAVSLSETRSPRATTTSTTTANTPCASAAQDDAQILKILGE